MSRTLASIEKTARKGIPGYNPWKLDGGCTFDVKRAAGAIGLFEKHITHQKGKLRGKPYILEDFEVAIMANLFGWYRADGTRRYREVFLYVPRKNSKSTFAAGVAVIVTFFDDEPGAENYCAAADADQANVLFSIAKGMVDLDPDLSGVAEQFKRSIQYPELGSFMQVLSSSADTKHGQNAHFINIDELHVCEKDLVDVLTTGTASRSQPIVFYTTTADVIGESVCNDTLEYAKNVRDGLVPAFDFLPVIYEADKGDDWKKPETWYKANPNLGKSIPLEYLEKECLKAQSRPSLENTFKRLHLNIQTEQSERWLSMEKWKDCGAGVDYPIEWRRAMLEKFKGDHAAAGLDLGSTSDFTAFVLLFEDGGDTVVLPFFWLPQDGDWTKDKRYKSHYENWIRDGYIILTNGEVCDYDQVREDIKGLASDYGIPEVHFDRGFQGGQLCSQLMEDGIGITAVTASYTYMHAPSQEFERRIINKTLKHGNNPVLTWMAANVTAQWDRSGKVMRPVRPRNQKRLKVDGIIAAIMGLIGMIAGDQTGGPSVYESRGVRTLEGRL